MGRSRPRLPCAQPSAMGASRSMIQLEPRRSQQGEGDMTGRHPRQRPILLRLRLVLSASAAAAAAGLGTPAAIAQSPADAAGACAKLATLSNFPLAATQITLAKFNARGSASANGVALPDHCQIQGIINKRVGTDGFPYGDRFEVRLPTPLQW